jgi:signal transduction histidine kinase
MTIGSRVKQRLTELAVGHRLPRRTVRVRLTLLYGGLFLLSGAALVAMTYVLFERATEYTQPPLPQVPHAPAIGDLHLSALEKGLPPLAQALPQLAYVQHQLAQNHRLILAMPKASGFAPVQRPLPQLVHDQHQLAQDQHQLAQGQHQLAQAVDQLAGAVHQMARAGAVQAAQRAADSHQLLVDSGIALAVVAVLALLTGWLIAGRMLRPIRTITGKARRISSASLHERLALDGPPDELKELGDTLDDLLGRLDAAFEAQRQFVANASHELRTPLTRQRALIQVALADPQANLSSLRAAHERVLASERHLEQLIDALLTLTRSQAGLERTEPVDLAALASQALLPRESQLEERDLDVCTTLDPARAAGDPRLLERLIANLIDNAIRHNRAGGRVDVTTGTREGRAFVSIENTGPTVPPEEIQRLFQPFQRLGSARSRPSIGYGLGLSIVQAIANAHRAELSVCARAEGGLAFDVSLPTDARADGNAWFGAATMRATAEETTDLFDDIHVQKSLR